MYAIIETGGKQYRVQKDDVFHVEKLNAQAGDKVTFDKVVAVGGDELKVGAPYVEGCKVTAEVVEHGKEKKVIVYKYKAKKDYRRKNGHRQPYTMVKILGIGEGEMPEVTTAAPTLSNDEVKVSMSMKKDELLGIAEQLGIKVNAKATKQEIIDAINGAN